MATKTITVPDIGGATDVDVIEVLVKVGDHIKVDSPLVTLESDKATMEVPSADEGVVKSINIKAGSKVSMGSPLLILEIASVEKAPASPKNEVAPQPAKVESVAAKREVVPAVVPATTAAMSMDDVHGSPVVRRIAREFGVDLAQVQPTGPKQRIMKEDIQDYVKVRLSQSQSNSGLGLPSAPNVDFSKFGPTEIQPLSRIKKISGKNLHRNWVLIPHITQFGDADISELEAFRAAQKTVLEKKGIKLTPLVFVMKAVAAALKAYPQFNASLDATGENLILKKYCNVGVAVDTPEGLVVPVIRDVDKKGMLDLAKELSVVSEKARNKQLTANDMQGGCFSISSLGGIGGTAFTPIVNMPEVAILGVSKASHKPIYEDGKFVPKLMLPLSLSYDHRVIDGADGARFMVYLTNMLGDIRNLLL